MHRRFFLVALLCALCGQAGAADAPPVRVLVWDEQQPEQKSAYDNGFLGDALAAHLAKQPGFKVTSVNLGQPDQGLSDAQLDAAQVVIWWGHKKHALVETPRVEALVQRVLDGRLALVALHSAHFSQPFMRLMHERAKADVQKQVPAAELETAKFDFSAQLKRATVKPDARLTPSLERVDGMWRLIPPGCIFPAWRNDGAPGHVKTLLPEHPIA
ncbi:MAG: ThuA domain-containing protein, partial [Limisphaerales bacterium]